MTLDDMPDYDYDEAHDHCIRHRDEVRESKKCGCFYCLEIFPAEEIVWGRYEETTGSCPECGIDSVIPDAAGYPITDEFLKGMNDRWFCGNTSSKGKESEPMDSEELEILRAAVERAE